MSVWGKKVSLKLERKRSLFSEESGGSEDHNSEILEGDYQILEKPEAVVTLTVW